MPDQQPTLNRALSFGGASAISTGLAFAGNGQVLACGSSNGTGTGASNGSLGDGGACAAQVSNGQLVPLDIYIMLDQSASMMESVPGGTKWTAVTSALNAFINQPSLSGVGVGLQYFGVSPMATGCPAKCTTTADCGTHGLCISFINKCSRRESVARRSWRCTTMSTMP